MTIFNGTSGNDVAISNPGGVSALSGFSGGSFAALNDAIFDLFICGAGDDTVTISNNVGRAISGGAGKDTLHGGTADDQFNMHPGDVVAGEVLDGGGGNDTLLAQASGNYVVDFRAGSITSFEKVAMLAVDGTVVKTIFNASQVGGGQLAANLALQGGAFSSIEIVEFRMGSAFSVDLSAFSFLFNWGDEDFVRITGDAGSETMKGTSKNDDFFGGGGTDTFIGGNGNDSYVVDSAGDVITELAGAAAGKDMVVSFFMSIDLSKYANVEIGQVGGLVPGLNVTGTNADETLTGETNSTANVLIGKGGNDVYFAGTGDAVVDSGGAADSVKSESIALNLFTLGNGKIEHARLNGSLALNIAGNEGVNFLVGNTAANTINAFGGNDTILGLDGNDTLTGGAGLDTFVFNTALNAASNKDAITDFTAINDVIQLDDAIFTAAGPAGTLAASAFRSGAGAVSGGDVTDRIVYNTATGDLYYDADGNGGGAAIKFATLSTKPAISNADFLIA